MQTNEGGLGCAQYNSDTDDWTLVSPPSSDHSRATSSNETSPVRSNTPSEQDDEEEGASSGESSNQSAHDDEEEEKKNRTAVDLAKKEVELADDADDESDGMTEINLSSTTTRPLVECFPAKASGGHKDDCRQIREVDEDEDDLGLEVIPEEKFPPRQKRNAKQDTNSLSTTTTQTREVSTKLEPSSTLRSPAPDTLLEEPRRRGNDGEEYLRGRAEQRRHEELVMRALCSIFSISILICIAYLVHQSLNGINKHEGRAFRGLSDDQFEIIFADPTNHAYTELKLLNDDLSNCIEQENPTRGEVSEWKRKGSDVIREHEAKTNIRPFRGLVCYNDEVKWRKRFNNIKTEFNFDLRKIVKQIRQRLTNDILAKRYAHASFDLILNQLDYLDHVEQRRKDRALEKLKAENLELVRRLNKKTVSEEQHRDSNKSPPHQNYRQKRVQTSHDHSTSSLVILESDNARLRHEVDSLRARLGEKAGTVYIKQSMELEKCERDNSALKQFHHQVAQEVARDLKQLDPTPQKTYESLAILSDHDDSLSSRLASTRALLLKLGEEIGDLVSKNKALEENLKEVYFFNSLIVSESKKLIEDANLAVQDGQQQQETDGRPLNTDSNATTDQRTISISTATTTSDSGPRESVDDSSYYQARPSLKETANDWLMKRARLREQLRLSSSALERHLARTKRNLKPSSSPASTTHQKSHHMSNDKGSHHQHQFDSFTYNEQNHNRYYQEAAPDSKHSSSANYYQKDSRKNCKGRYKRDEL